ncbi:head-tail connector protein [Pararhodobacter sp.]|uniref:head-tail connector protein n=1 Tax=Pararhodobacter sp. TaxID=2127056 RepID=UPI002FDD6E66
MDVTETSGVPESALPIAGFRAHLRLGTGFADEVSSDGALAGYLRAAIAVIEGRTGKVLLSRSFRMVLAQWRWPDTQALPVAPVSAVEALAIRKGTGDVSVVAPGRWRLVVDRHRPRIAATGAVLPTIPQGGQAEVDFTAGFGASWDAVPDDLAQAVFLLAAHYYEGRTGAGAELPVSVAALISRWSALRVTAGGYRV